MGLFTKKSKRAQRHIDCINEMIRETDECSEAAVNFPVMEISVGREYGTTAIRLTFERKRIIVAATYDIVLSYYGKGVAFREFMKLNKTHGKEWKEKWGYGIDPDSQKMIFTEKYKMKYKPIGNDNRFNLFFDRVFREVPQNFDIIQGKMKMRGSRYVYPLANRASL